MQAPQTRILIDALGDHALACCTKNETSWKGMERNDWVGDVGKTSTMGRGIKEGVERWGYEVSGDEGLGSK
jgi:hypothetical protein